MDEKQFREKYYLEAKDQSIETLPDFIKKMFEEDLDYGSVCCAIAASAIAAAWAGDRHEKGGITGFQAGAVMWEFVRQWNYSTNECGLRIIDYDNMLYPQHEESFLDRTISQEQFKKIQEIAKKNLARGQAADKVLAHWQSIADGNVPFGYTIKEGD